jgi:hypothetical protein
MYPTEWDKREREKLFRKHARTLSDVEEYLKRNLSETERYECCMLYEIDDVIHDLNGGKLIIHNENAYRLMKVRQYILDMKSDLS